MNCIYVTTRVEYIILFRKRYDATFYLPSTILSFWSNLPPRRSRYNKTHVYVAGIAIYSLYRVYSGHAVTNDCTAECLYDNCRMPAGRPVYPRHVLTLCSPKLVNWRTHRHTLWCILNWLVLYIMAQSNKTGRLSNNNNNIMPSTTL